MVRQDEVLRYLKQIEEEEGVLDPHSVIEHARSEYSPIHDRFTWDDTEAAIQYRLQQARQLIREVTIEWQGNEVQEFHNVVITKGKRGYVSLERILSDEDLHKQVLEEALKELRHWQIKYRTLKELQGIIFEEKVSRIEKTL